MYFFTLFDVSGVLIIARVSGSGTFLATAHAVSASETLYRIGLVLGLIGTLSTILLAVGLSSRLSELGGLVSGASVVGTNVSVVFFGVGSTLFFYLLVQDASHSNGPRLLKPTRLTVRPRPT